jgi:putative FmdB family regulatory protein
LGAGDPGSYTAGVPTYEYLCTVCDTRFEQRRPMAESDAPAECPDGHTAKRLLSVFAATSGTGDGLRAGAMGDRPAEPCSNSCACF